MHMFCDPIAILMFICYIHPRFYLKASVVHTTKHWIFFTFVLRTSSDDGIFLSKKKHECERVAWQYASITMHMLFPPCHDARSGKCVSLLHCWCHGMCNHLHSVVLFFISALPSTQLLEFQSPCEWLMCQATVTSVMHWCNNVSSHFSGHRQKHLLFV